MTHSEKKAVVQVAYNLEALAAVLQEGQGKRGTLVEALLMEAKKLHGVAAPKPATDGQ